MYSHYDDKCYTYCPWGINEPSIMPLEVDIYIFRASDNNGYLYNAPSKLNNKYLCYKKADPTQVAFIATNTVGTTGGQITFILGGSISTAKPTLTFGKDNKPLTDIKVVVAQASANITATVPPGVGVIDVTIGYTPASEAAEVKLTTRVQYQPPHIEYIVLPSFNKDDSVTIVGSNFGSKDLAVNFGIKKISCDKPTIDTLGSIVCILSADITDNFLPVQVIVGDVETTTYKTAFFYTKTSPNTLFSLEYPFGSRNDSKAYAEKKKAGSYVGKLGYPLSDGEYTFIRHLEPTNQKSFANNFTTLFYLGNPSMAFCYNNKISGLPTGNTSCVDANPPTPYSYVFEGQYIVNDPTISQQPSGLLTRYSNPVATIDAIADVNTAGEKRTVTINNCGTLYSTISLNVTIYDAVIPLSLARVDGVCQFSIDLPSAYDGPHQVQASIDGHQPINVTSVQYSLPSATAQVTFATEGGNATVTGINFFPNATTLVYGDQVLQPVEEVTTTVLAKFTFPAQTDPATPMFIKVGQQKSVKALEVEYSPPAITLATLDYRTDLMVNVTVNGTSFGPSIANVALTSSSTDKDTVTNPLMVNPHQSIVFTALMDATTKAYPNLGDITVKVNSKSSVKAFTIGDTSSYPLVTSITSSQPTLGKECDLILNGTNLLKFTIELTKVTIGGSECVVNVTATNDTTIVCHFKSDVEIPSPLIISGPTFYTVQRPSLTYLETSSDDDENTATPWKSQIIFTMIIVGAILVVLIMFIIKKKFAANAAQSNGRPGSDIPFSRL
eukprot:gene11432-13327_t